MGKYFGAIGTLSFNKFGNIQDSWEDISGSILNLGAGVELGAFTDQFAHWGNGVEALKQGVYYYVPSGKAAGSGRLSNTMALSAREWVRGGLRDPKLRSERYRGPMLKPREPAYQKWVNDVGFGRTPVMSLTGLSAGLFGVISSKRGGVSLGIAAKHSDRTPLPYVTPLDYGNKVQIQAYMRAHELGALKGQPARPVMSGLVTGYLQRVQPAWGGLFYKQMQETFWKYSDKSAPTNLVEYDQAGGATGIVTAKRVRTRGSLTQKAKESRRLADALHKISPILSTYSENKVFTAAELGAAGAFWVSDALQQMGYSAVEIEKVIAGLVHGKDIKDLI